MEDGFYVAMLYHVLVLLNMLLPSWSDYIRLYTFDPPTVVEHKFQCKSHHSFSAIYCVR